MDFPAKSRDGSSKMWLRRGIQGLILAFFSFDLLLTLYNTLSYFLPLITALSSVSSVPVLGARVSLLKGVLLVVLLGLTIPDVKSDRKGIEHAYLLVLSIGVVLYYRLRGTLFGLYFVLLVALAVSIAFSRVTSRGDWRTNIADGLSHTSTVALLGVGAGILSAFSVLPQLVLGVLGLYYGGRWVLTRNHLPDVGAVDIEEQIYRATLRLGETKTGVLVAGLVYAGLFSTSSVILSLVFPILLQSGFSFAPQSLLLNLSYVFGMGFQAVIFYYWFALLQRAPYSVSHWDADRFEYETQQEAPARPRPLNLLLPTVGWMLTQYPSSAVEQYGPVITLLWSSPSIWIFLTLQAALLAYSLVPVPAFRWLYRLPLAQFLSISNRSIKNDRRTYAVSIPLLLLGVAASSTLSAFLLALISVMFFLDYHLERRTVAALFILILVTFLIAPLAVRLGSLEGRYWSFTLLIVLLYGTMFGRQSVQSL